MGRPAFGYAVTGTGAIAARSARNGRISRAPSAQLMPTEIGFACCTDAQNASIVWPESVRPLRSVIVTEIRIGSSTAELVEHVARGDDRGLRVQRVEDRLDQDRVDAALDERAHLLGVGGAQRVEVEIADTPRR